jgi:hypothetical protein
MTSKKLTKMMNKPEVNQLFKDGISNLLSAKKTAVTSDVLEEVMMPTVVKN